MDFEPGDIVQATRHKLTRWKVINVLKNDEIRIKLICDLNGDTKNAGMECTNDAENFKLIERPIVEDTRSYLEAITNEELGGS